MRERDPGPGRCGERGLTLLELLLVVLILAALAGSAVAFLEGAEDHASFEDTRARLAAVRRAVAGRPGDSVNGQPLVSGFVADLGRLPSSLQELLERGTLPAWGVDPATGQGAGWRGPYLEPRVERDASGAAVRTFRDGWRNAGGPPLHGWKRFEASDADGTLLLESPGADGAPGGTGYAADYPPPGFLLEKDDHSVDVAPLSMAAAVENATGAALVLRLRLLHPRDGSLAWPAAWPSTAAARDAAPWLSGAETFPPGTTTRTLRFLVLSGGVPVPKRVPWGVRTLLLVNDADGRVLDALPPVTIRLVPRAAPPELPAATLRVETTP